MKKIILSIFVAASVLVSCSDAYEAEQPTNRSDESVVFANADEISRGIVGLYSGFNIESEINFVSYFTDELGVGISNGGQGVNDGSYTFIMTPANGFATSNFGTNMNIVNRVNRMLNRIEQLYTETPEDKAKLDSNKAELLAFRAYCHYKLFAYYTPDYKNPSGLSVIKFDFLQTDDYNRKESRSTVGEIVSFIEKDISEARQLGIINESDNSLITESFLDAILVKLYSMTENYNGLEEAFNRLKEKHTTGNALDYQLTFADDAGSRSGNPDIILRMERRVNQGQAVAASWYSDLVGPSAAMIYMEVGRSLYNELDKLDPDFTGEALNDDTQRKDVRYAVNILNGSKVATNYQSLSQDQFMNNDVLLVGKYTGRSANPLQNDVYVFRFTDMLLALAEKRAYEGLTTGNVALGDYSNVESIIFNIRASRNSIDNGTPLVMPSNFSSREQAYARILEERRLEFAFEGHRYLDMKRLGVKAKSDGFVRYSKDCASTNACQLEANSFKMVLPIPSSEMISNNKMVQNPGY